MKKLKFIVPLLFFFILVVFLAIGLKRNPNELPSALLGKAVPEFSLPNLDGSDNISPQQFKHKVWLLNVWSTWCVSCRDEHAELNKLANSKIGDFNFPPIVGLSYKELRGDASVDQKKLPNNELELVRERANNWLKNHGNPYKAVALDIDGKAAMNFGVYGVPETYVIDQNGIVVYKYTGPITAQGFESKLLPILTKQLN